MNKILAAERLRWFSLAGLVVTTAATAPIFMSGFHVWQEDGLFEELTADRRYVEYFGELPGDDVLAFASTPTAGLGSLLWDAPELVPLGPLADTQLVGIGPAPLGYLADDRSADQGFAGGANTNEGFAGGGHVLGGNAGLEIDPPAIWASAMPSIGGYGGATPTNASESGGAPPAVVTAPRSLTERSTRPDRRITRSPRTEAPTAVVAGVGLDLAMPATKADQASTSGSPPSDERVEKSSLEFPAAGSPDSILSSSNPLLLGQTPDIIDTDTALALASHDLLGAGSNQLEQHTADAAEENIVLAAITASNVVSDASTTALSTAPLQAEGPNQVIAEPGTLALLGLGFGLAGLSFSRRKQ